MAEYSLAPYLFSAGIKYSRDEGRKMGNFCQDPDLTASEFVTNCFQYLVEEESPRKFGADGSRRLDGIEVLRHEDQILFKMRVGVTGFTSDLELSDLGKTARRNHSDPEWFNLRAMFASVPGSRRGLLLVERVANYSAYGALSDVLKAGARSNLNESLTIKLDPVQDPTVMGQNLSEMLTKAIEFRTTIDPERTDVADRAAGEDTVQPLKKAAGSALKKYSRYFQRGGLGLFDSFRGQSVEELSQRFGYIPDPGEDTDSLDIVATVEDRDGKPHTFSVLKEETGSVSFPIERMNQDSEPTDDEFFSTVEEVVGVLANYTSVTPDRLVSLQNFVSVDEFLGVEEWRLNE